jgi:hypothetical protein
MKFRISLLIYILLPLLSFSQGRLKVDLIVFNAQIYTVDSGFHKAEAFAVDKGKFVAVGSDKDILAKYSSRNRMDMNGRAVYPGFTDAHCHFYSYGLLQNQVDLVGCKSFKEVVDRLMAYNNKKTEEENKNLPKIEMPTAPMLNPTIKMPNMPQILASPVQMYVRWIMGRGWDQNLWANKEFPTKDTLDKLFPNTPVYLARVDGHAALVNQFALDKAGININTEVEGGKIISKNGQLTGVLVDNATDLVKKVIPKPNDAEIQEALVKAQTDCFGVGLTTVDDAGLEKHIVDVIDTLQKQDILKMRIYAMLTDNSENLGYYLHRKPYKTDRLDVRSFKFYADGALGSRGACLLKPYSDKPNETGFLLHKPQYYKEMAQMLVKSGYQMNTHCIGDSANRTILDIYASVLPNRLSSNSEKLQDYERHHYRWRIEHAQVVSKEPAYAYLNDYNVFGLFDIVPSVQPTHATSDMAWAEDRLGPQRMKGAYAYKDLLKQTGYIALGSDFPVESINPILGFYAAVFRKNTKGEPKGGFQMENALTREEALKGMTIWAAYANFEEKEKGSIEPGKFADFVVLDRDIMTVKADEVFPAKVLYTYLNGEIVYRAH